MTRRRAATLFGPLVVLAALGLSTVRAAGGLPSIVSADLQQWLTYLASDDLQGRAVFSEGLGLAAGYIQRHLQEWGVAPAGDGGSYLQTVRVLSVKSESRSTVTVRVGNETRTFKDGDGIRFPRSSGGKQSITLDRVEFAGYGVNAPDAGHTDFRNTDVRGAAVVFLGNSGPRNLDPQRYRLLLNGRSRHATDQLQAAATIGPPPEAPAGGASRPAETRPNAPDFTTTRRLDLPIPPAVTGSDAFFTFLFSRAPERYDELKRRASARDSLPRFRLDNVTLTFNVDADYTVVRTQLTQNVVAMVEGADPQLKTTYVAFGAHYDHIGYADGEMSDGRRSAPPGRVTAGAEADRVWNGADDDGSGTVALMALARAFQLGPRPKRSLLFIWHAGEERGLLGSRYFADYPTVPIDRVMAELNIDMVGRNRNDDRGEANTVYLVGSDRISTELHDLNHAANAALDRPLALNYELNDPTDLEQIYYRSDHYSYASKGIPIIFFTTGLHSDYHANTDEVSKIDFGKLTRVAQLVFETGRRVADLDRPLLRDNKGPRAGKGTR